MLASSAKRPGRGFEPMGSRDQDQEWEMAGTKKFGAACEVTVQASETRDFNAKGIMVTRSTEVRV